MHDCHSTSRSSLWLFWISDSLHNLVLYKLSLHIDKIYKKKMCKTEVRWSTQKGSKTHTTEQTEEAWLTWAWSPHHNHSNVGIIPRPHPLGPAYEQYLTLIGVKATIFGKKQTQKTHKSGWTELPYEHKCTTFDPSQVTWVDGRLKHTYGCKRLHWKL